MSRRLRPIVAVLAAATLIAGACGDDDTAPGGASNGAAGADSPSSSGPAEGITFSDSNQYKADVDRTGETIKMGITNTEGPSFSNPEMRQGALVGVEYVNENGGVNGAMLDPVECVSDGTPEGAINCANEFIEADVDLVTYGAELAMDAAAPLYNEAGIPVISDFAYNQTPYDNIWALSSPLGSYSLYAVVAANDLGVSKLSYLHLDTPYFRAQADMVRAWGETLGVEVVDTPAVDPSVGDWTSAVQTALSNGAEMFVNYAPSSQVQASLTVTRQLGFDGPFLTTDTQYVSEVGAADVRNTYVIGPRFLTPEQARSGPERIQENFEIYEQAMTDAGHEDLVQTYAEHHFTSMMDIRTILEMIPEGPIDLQTITAALSEDRDIIGFDSADFNCGADPWPADGQFCRSYQLVVEVVEDGDGFGMEPLHDDAFGFYNDPELNAQSTSLG